MRILSAQRLGEHDCALSVDFGGASYELVARRIGLHAGIAGVGHFEPANFHGLPLSVPQIRALVRAAVALHEGAPLMLPVDVPA